MKICFISSYPPNHARLSEYAQHLVNEIAKRPTVKKIYVLADTVNGIRENYSESSKIEVLRAWEADNPLSIIKLIFQILRLKPDIVHYNVHFQSYGRTRLANFLGFSLVPLSRIVRLRTMVLLHNLGEKVDLAKVRLKPTFVNKTGILVATKLVLAASSVVVTVPSYAKFLKKRHGHKGLKYIPHGTSAYKRLTSNHEGKIVLMFGHMGPSKGLHIMFQAFEQMLKERDDIKLVIAGDSHPNFPGYLQEIVKSAPPKAEFLGYIQEDDIAKVFSMADVVVLPYFTATGTSGVFHLACGYGKPIVASALPEIRELVNEGASALLVSIGDVVALKEAILKVLLNRDAAVKMGEQNLAFAHREKWSVIAEEYEKLYLKLLNIKQSDPKVSVSIVIPSCEASKKIPVPSRN